MNKVIYLILIMVGVVLADNYTLKEKAELIVYNYNSVVQKGNQSERHTLCYVRNGLYMTYHGETYVIDVSYVHCNWQSDYSSGRGTTLCLSYQSVHKAKKMCECDGETVTCM